MTIKLKNLRRTTLFAHVFACALWSTLSIPVLAQDNPFGGDDPFGAGAPMAGGAFDAPAAANAPANPSAIRQQDPDPVIRMLHSHPPKTPAAMADGLIWTVRLKRWDEVGNLLNRLNATGWTVEQKAEVARRVGAATLLRMGNPESTLTEEQRKIAGELFGAPSTLARNPQWIDQTIDILGTGTPAERQVAQLRLHDSGALAIERLVNRLLAGDATVPPARLAAAAVSFGEEGGEALRAACVVADPLAASRVPLALAELPAGEFGSEISAALVSRVTPLEQQQALASLLSKKYATLPTSESIALHLKKRFDDALASYQLQRQSDPSITDYVWRPSPSGSAVQRVDVPQPEKALEYVARYAALRMQVQTATNDGLVDAAAVLLQRAYKVRPQLYAAEGPAQLLAAFPEEVSSNFGWWQEVFARCNEWQLHGAAVRTLQSMADGIVQGEFDPPSEFLAKLLRDSRPAIRYTALELFERIDPKSSYFGNEWALETAIEMSRLDRGPRALVIGLQGEIREVAQQQIRMTTGAEVSVVNSGAAALKVLDEPLPTELIFIVDRVADQSISQLIQRLRRSRRGHSLPIAVLTEQLYSYERDAITETAGVVSSVLSRNPEQMQRVISLLERNLDTAPLTASDRASFVTTANRFLARIASDREHYAFYPLSRWKNEISDRSANVTPAARISLLSGLGSPDSQRQLVEMTMQSGLDELQRLDAARGFGRSVKQFGMALNRTDITQTYEIYNNIGPTDPTAVKAVGLVLDLIEAHAGKTPWPEGF